MYLICGYYIPTNRPDYSWLMNSLIIVLIAAMDWDWTVCVCRCHSTCSTRLQFKALTDRGQRSLSFRSSLSWPVVNACPAEVSCTSVTAAHFRLFTTSTKKSQWLNIRNNKRILWQRFSSGGATFCSWSRNRHLFHKMKTRANFLLNVENKLLKLNCMSCK